MKTTEILTKYTTGELTLEDANKKLKEADAGFYLNPDKNNLTEEEIKNGTAALLDTGTGSFDKVRVKDGELVDDMGAMEAIAMMGGKTFRVEGKKLIET